MTSQKSMKDLLAGLIFIGFGIAFGYTSLTYDVGTALRMGPGYFPLILAVVILLLGVVIVVQAFVAGPDEIPLGRVPWLGLILLVGGLVFFGATVRGLGLAPSLFVTVFTSAFASQRTGFLGALALAAALTFICTAIFIWALGMPLAVIGPWARF